MSISPGTNIQNTILGLTSPEVRFALPAPASISRANVAHENPQVDNNNTNGGVELSAVSDLDRRGENARVKPFLEIEVDGRKEKIEIPITSTRMRVDEETKRIVIQILNAKNEVLKQIPPEEWLKFLAKWQKIQGLFFDERV